MKRLLSLASFAALALIALPSAGADPYPTKPIRWLVAYAPGGGTDVLARTLTRVMQPSLGQSIVVDNRPGAATNIAVDLLIQSKADGYTLMQAENTTLAFNEHLYPKLSYSPEKDFTYIASIGRFPLALVVHPDFPAKDLAEFTSYVKLNAGRVNYASPGNGTAHHMAMELFKQRTRLDLTHVSYKGVAPAMQDLFGGQVQVMMLDLAGGLTAIKAGRVRVLAIAAEKRVSALPDVPTFAELGVAGVEGYAFQGLIGPARMPADVVSRLNAEVIKAVQNPDTQKLLSDFGMEALPATPEQFRQYSRTQSARWGEVIKATGLRLD